MIVTLLGVRGSRPVATEGMLRYGGNTTSFKVEVPCQAPIYIDGGTGLYEEGVRLMEKGIEDTITILMTHSHWDHILSFPYFAPLYDERCRVHFYAAVSGGRPFRDLIQGQHNPLAFPVPYNQLKAAQVYTDVKPGDVFQVGGAKLSSYQLNHDGTTLGWRIDADSCSAVIVTDTAPIHGNYLGEGMSELAKADPAAFEADYTAGLLAFMRNADLVIYDTHFTAEGIVGKKHWGHSTPRDAVEMCLRAGAKRLILHHHAPADTDSAVDAKLAEALSALPPGSALSVRAGVEGMSVAL